MNQRSKIGVLTFHRCINYGSYWQARALVEGLRARGHAAEILDHQSRWVKRAEWKCGLQPVLPTPVPSSDRRLYAAKMRTFFEAFEALPLSAPFDLHRPEEMDDYDTVVVGSDEVWNLHHPWYGQCGLFYGDGLRAQRLVSYAASFGSYSAWWGLSQEWADRLARFASISVRDENSRALVDHHVGVNPTLVLDPCLQFPLAVEPGDAGAETPYVAVYGHNFTGAFVEQVRHWASRRGYPLVSIGYRNDWADRQWLDASPHDFARFIAGAAAVATNFFHGCVFSLRNARPFVCEVSPYRSLKVLDLMATVGGERHLISEEASPAAVASALDEPLSEAVRHRIAALRRQSESFLDQALAVPQLQHA